jgi:hypothetical protein
MILFFYLGPYLIGSFKQLPNFPRYWAVIVHLVFGQKIRREKIFFMQYGRKPWAAITYFMLNRNFMALRISGALN